MSRAVASHILVASETDAIDLKQQIEGGADFGDLARQHSQCPSGEQSGGSLGDFGQGDMVPEFDKVVFGDIAVGAVSEPVKTQFGYHIIRVDKRA